MKKFLFLCLIVFGIVFTGCQIQESTTKQNYTEEGLQIIYLNTTVRQSLYNVDNHSTCLANYNNDVIFLFSVDATELRNGHHFYYDNYHINDYYVLVGTYTYLTKSGNYRTVPALMLKLDYYDCKNWAGVEYLKQVINIVVTYSILGESEYSKKDNNKSIYKL